MAGSAGCPAMFLGVLQCFWVSLEPIPASPQPQGHRDSPAPAMAQGSSSAQPAQQDHPRARTRLQHPPSPGIAVCTALSIIFLFNDIFTSLSCSLPGPPLGTGTSPLLLKQPALPSTTALRSSAPHTRWEKEAMQAIFLPAPTQSSLPGFFSITTLPWPFPSFQPTPYRCHTPGVSPFSLFTPPNLFSLLTAAFPRKDGAAAPNSSPETLTKADAIIWKPGSPDGFHAESLQAVPICSLPFAPRSHKELFPVIIRAGAFLYSLTNCSQWFHIKKK